MNNKFKMRVVASSVAACLLLPASAMATNGYFLIGFGAQQRGMGGAAVASTNDGLAASVNAAAMTDIETRFDIGGDLFMPKAAVYVDSVELPADHESTRDTFMVPNMGMVYKWSDKISVGFAMIGAGAATRYDQPVAACADADPLTVGNNFFNFSCNASDPFQGDIRLSIDMYQMQMLPSIAYKVNDQHSVGASLVIGFQMFRAYGFGAMNALGFSTSSGALTNNNWDRSYGFGLRASWLGKFMDNKLKVGVNYSPRVD
ncbi:MAG: outer membrane protein transport protein, partial [Gammaproteobacteria bacterium]|nr:outer membrane protein transport protein [Gammaproteobacteria bacterium]